MYLKFFLVFLVTVPVFLFPRALLLLFVVPLFMVLLFTVPLFVLLIPVSSNDHTSQASVKINLFAFLSFMMLISGDTGREKPSAYSDSATDL